MILRAAATWGAVALALGVPITLSALSPYLQYRQPIYIAAGFAGIIGLALLLIQPLLATQSLPGLRFTSARRAHRMAGAALLVAVVVHVVGLWITSPPDVIDALTFTSPTAFSAWGVVAMWAVFGTAVLAVFRRKVRLRPWRIGHGGFAILITVGTIVHAALIEGTMEQISKLILCALVALATLRALASLQPGVLLKGPKGRG